MANWTDQTQQVFTEQDFDSKWGGHGGKHFCTLCNKDFQVGDKWRWICTTYYHNFQVCEQCDGPDVKEKYIAACNLLFESLKGRGEGHWPVDIAARLIAAREQISEQAFQLQLLRHTVDCFKADRAIISEVRN